MPASVFKVFQWWSETLLDRLSEDQVVQMSWGEKDVKNCGVMQYEYDASRFVM